ncbi:hypothetical protein T479_05805 [Lysinibacillus varians]|nr:hypothetical protein T479_05805 [Lysinibacillus varians]
MRDSFKISYKHQDEKGNIAGFFQFWEEAILETINTSIKILVEDTFQRGGNHKENTLNLSTIQLEGGWDIREKVLD